MIAVFHIKLIAFILKMYDLPYLNTYKYIFITYEFARSASTAVVILRSKNNSLVEFSINIACYEKKRNDTWSHEDKKM